MISLKPCGKPSKTGQYGGWEDTQANGVSFENEDYVWWYVSEELELVE